MSLESFLSGDSWEPVASSNVREIAYAPDQGWILVRFHSGSGHWYEVGREQAEAFYAAPSKGTWLWDNVRVRGTRDEHKVDHGPL